MLRSVNRVLLALTGLGLVATGGAVLAAALDLPARLNLSLPDRYAWQGPEDVLLSRADRLQWRDDGWWWPVVIGSLIILLLLALWWALAQLRRQRLHEVLVRGSPDNADELGALVRGRAMEDVMTAEAEALPGVDQARVTLIGSRVEPRAQIGLLMSPQAHPAEVVSRVRSEVLANAMNSAALPELPSEVRLRSTRHSAERVT